MNQLIECVPNVSEGRRREVVDGLWEAIGQENGVSLLDRSSDPSHNRTVFTFAGDARAVRGAVMRLYDAALNRLDMREHQGEHPRLGAVDVVPFVPIRGCDLPFCAELARSVGQEVGARFSLPVYLYSEAAVNPDRRLLSTIRKGEFEGLAEKLSKPEWRPDFGPTEPHPTAGATVIGARPFLIAYNLQLDTESLKVAQAIAKAVRASSGGLANIQAMGVYLEDRRCGQVSMNLLHFDKTPLYRISELVKVEAARFGVRVMDSEIVGLVPQAALNDAASFYLQVGNWSGDLVFEERFRRVQEGRALLVDLPVDAFTGALASEAPTPGGGSAAALAGAMAASLVEMVGRLTLKPAFENERETAELLRDQGEDLRISLLGAVDRDAQAFNSVMEAMAQPKDTSQEKAARRLAIQEATKRAAQVPLEVASEALSAAELALTALKNGNPNAASDAGTAAMLALAGLEGALMNVAINLAAIKDEAWVKQRRDIVGNLLARSFAVRDEVWEQLESRFPEFGIIEKIRGKRDRCR